MVSGTHTSSSSLPAAAQLHHLQNAMDHYQSSETSRVSERSNLTDILLHTLGTSAPSSGAIFRAEFHNEVEELTTLLKRNLLQERAAQCTMADFLSSLVLTPLQVVKMAAVSYPYFPVRVSPEWFPTRNHRRILCRAVCRRFLALGAGCRDGCCVVPLLPGASPTHTCGTPPTREFRHTFVIGISGMLFVHRGRVSRWLLCRTHTSRCCFGKRLQLFHS